MEGCVVTMQRLSVADIFVTATEPNVINIDHTRKKDRAIVCNIGHFDNEIDVDPI